MKKIFFILLFGLFGFFANAQHFEVLTADTLTNADTITWTIDSGAFKSVYNGWIGVYMETDSLSGTTAVTFYYDVSADGTNWTPLSTDTSSTDNELDNLENRFLSKYFRVRAISTGTQSTIVGGQFGFKRENR